jgi:two-component system chemotaxis response regulator CheB
MSGQRSTRVIVCDDSPTFTSALQRLLEHDGDIEVVGIHDSAEATIAALGVTKPDLVTMDLELPGIDGLEAVGRIMADRPVPILVLSVDDTIGDAAVAAGALAAIAKSQVDILRPEAEASAALRKRVKLLAGAPVIHHPRSRLRPGVPRAAGRIARATPVIGICASTGGPQALAHLLAELPEGFPLPILLVQHISSGFTDGLARWLDSLIPLPVRLARAGVPVGPGVWLAPEDAHLSLEPDRTMQLDRHTVVGHHRPSGDVLLSSMASVLGADAIGVVLSGMGHDGADGIAAIAAAGGVTIAQDEETSVVYGMPRSAAERGVERVLALEHIAPALLAVARGRR